MYSGLVLAKYHVEALLDEFYMKGISATFIAILISIFHEIGLLVHILIMLLVVSFVLDFWLDIRERRLSRLSINKAVIKIVLYAIGIIVVGLTARAVAEAAGTSFGMDTWFVALICVNEALACLAILSLLGFPVPQWIIARLKAFNEDPIQAARAMPQKPQKAQKGKAK